MSFLPKKSCTRSWDTLEAAASSWESAVDMEAVEAAGTKPAIRAKKMPCWPEQVGQLNDDGFRDSELVPRKEPCRLW